MNPLRPVTDGTGAENNHIQNLAAAMRTPEGQSETCDTRL